jgi:hypothetical protein
MVAVVEVFSFIFAEVSIVAAWVYKKNKELSRFS